MKRGAVVTIAAGSGFGSKPRPALIVQADEYTTPDTVIVAPFTSELADGKTVRPRYEPTAANGLRRPSELMVDILITSRRSKLGVVLGNLDREGMARADRALLAILGLAS